MERGAYAIHVLLKAIAPAADPDDLWDVSLLAAGVAQDIHILTIAWATPKSTTRK